MKSALRVSRDISMSEFLSAVGAKATGDLPSRATGISLDSRTIEPGDLFFALVSVRDGHEYVKDAIQKGASAVVVSRPIDSSVVASIQVEDTLSALWRYAHSIRKKWGKPIVALSGSNGKTSTKQMIGTLLGEKTCVTPGNWNNFFGVPLTLSMLTSEHDLAVIEIGINDFGELRKLVPVVDPNVAMLTNVGPAHLEKLGDLEGVAKAKSEIFEQLKPSDTAVLNVDDRRIAGMKAKIRANILTVSQIPPADVYLIDRKPLPSGFQLKVQYGSDEVEITLHLVGEHQVSNYLCALGVAKAFGIPADQIAERTQKIRAVEMRMQTYHLAGSRTLINDCYNANPGSFNAALEAVSQMKPKRFLLLAGDMLELGRQTEQIHHDLAKKFKFYGVNELFVTGDQSASVVSGAKAGGLAQENIHVLENNEKEAEKILSIFNPGDILLVKASRGMALEKIADELRQRLKD